MSRFLSLFLLLPLWSYAAVCQAPWQAAPSPVSHVKSCRLSVPHGWLVFNLSNVDMEIPQSLFYPDEQHEWVI
jgi:hypothetical protein